MQELSWLSLDPKTSQLKYKWDSRSTDCTSSGEKMSQLGHHLG